MPKESEYSRGHKTGYAQALAELLTAPEAAARMGVETTVLTRRANRRGVGRHVGNWWIFSVRELEDLKPTWTRPH